MTDDRMKIAYLHKTFITNGRKTEGINAKKLFTATGLTRHECVSCGAQSLDTAAVRLFNCGSTLGVAEGLETALSTTQIYDVPTWMLGNATYLKTFIAPPHVKQLVIYADNDQTGTGLMAAFACGNKNILRREGVEKVIIRCPEHVGDFNDMLKIQSDVRDWTLTRKSSSSDQ